MNCSLCANALPAPKPNTAIASAVAVNAVLTLTSSSLRPRCNRARCCARDYVGSRPGAIFPNSVRERPLGRRICLGANDVEPAENLGRPDATLGDVILDKPDTDYKNNTTKDEGKE